MLNPAVFGRCIAVVLLPISWLATASSSSLSSTTSSNGTVLLADSFSPPQVFENTNLVRNVNLEKSYPRETVNVVIKNVASTPQSEYYLPISTDVISRIGSFEVRNKKDASLPPFEVEIAQYESPNPISYYVIHLAKELAPSQSQTISISYTVSSALRPLPAEIEQTSAQTVYYAFSAHVPSAYVTQKQKTKLKLPTAKPADYTELSEKNADGSSDPTHLGTSLTYGPYDKVNAWSGLPVGVRYDFTKPLMQASLLERDVEVSHWGGNLATEERYWITNKAAKLKNQFSRVQWQMTQYASPPTTAMKELRVPLLAGSLNPYYTDDIGNVSTSKFRPGRREAQLDLKPRYPIFGGWNYSFKIGWDADLSNFLKHVKGEGYVLKFPFIQGPKTAEGISYEKIVLRVILPEGARNIKFSAPISLASASETIRHTFMDTLGRPTLVLTGVNAVDEWRDRGDLVVTYDYPWTAGYRKPLTIAAALLTVFAGAWVLGNIDVRIGKRS